MNILQILPRLEVGGVETGTVDISKELVKKGHKVIVVSNGGRMVGSLLDCGARHIRLPVHKKSLFTVIKMSGKLRDIIKEERIDVVHARSRVPAIIAFFACRKTGTPFITTAHGYYSTHLFSRVMGWGRYVIVASGIIGRHMIKNFSVPRERIKFIPRGVDLDKFRFRNVDISQKSEYKVAVIGRITPIKGHAFFLQSIARVIRVFPKVKILIVGDAPEDKPEYKHELESLIRRLNITDFVEFLGSRKDISKIMSEIDLLILPSVGQEAFGRVIIEAGASGIPVIATRIGGVVDIVEDGVTGILVRSGDIMEMVDSILKLLKNRELAANLAVEARKKVEKEYSLEKMTEETLKIYRESIKKKRILIIKIGAIGDVILVTPSLRVIRNAFPEASITVLLGAEARRVLKKCPYIDDIILYDRSGNDYGPKGFFRVGEKIRKADFDMSVDFQNNRASHLLAWLGSVPKRYGYNNRKLGFLINQPLRRFKIDVGPVEEQFRVLKKAGVNTAGASKRLEVWPSKEDFSYVDEFLSREWVSDEHLLVGVNIGGSWRTKRWPLKYFARLSDMLSLRGVRIVITASEEEKDLSEDFTRMTRAKVIDASGKTTIMQLAALIKRCKVFVTGDSAPMHLASSVGTDFIALFGPTDPRRHFEPTPRGIVVKKEVKCAPCYRERCRKMECMKKISPDEIYKLIMNVIERPKVKTKTQKPGIKKTF